MKEDTCLFWVTILCVWCFILSIGVIAQGVRISKLERINKAVAVNAIKVQEEAAKQRRINSQNLHVLANGGWYDFSGINSDD